MDTERAQRHIRNYEWAQCRDLRQRLAGAALVLADISSMVKDRQRALMEAMSDSERGERLIEAATEIPVEI